MTRRRLLYLVLFLAFLPFLLLHALVLVFTFRETPVAGTEKRVYAQPDGTPLVSYERDQPQARLTVIFVHGTPATGAAFREQMRGDFPQINQITYDRPGFGASPGGREKANLPYQTQTLLGLIAHITSPKVILVGHSYGGPIALLAATRAPERIAGVVTIGGSVSPQEEHPWMIQYFGDLPGIRTLLPAPLRSCNEELLTLKKDLIQMDDQLHKISCPILMLQGTDDDQVPVSNVPYLQARFKALGKEGQLQAEILPGFNHFMMWEQPGVVNRNLQQFISKVSP